MEERTWVQINHIETKRIKIICKHKDMLIIVCEVYVSLNCEIM